MVGKSFSQPQDSAALAHSVTASYPIATHNAIPKQPIASDGNHRDEEASIRPSPHLPSPSKNWSFPLIALLACTMTGGTAAIAFLSLTALPPETDCTQSAATETDRGLLYCVQQAAQSGDIEKVLNGLDILGQWTTADPLYYEAQASLEKWSRTVLVTARHKLRNNELDEAIAFVEKVPQSSPLYEEAQNLLSSWQNQADQAQEIVATAEEALKQKNWDQVSQQIQALGTLTAYTQRSEHIRQLSEQLRLEKENDAIFQSVLRTAQTNTPPAIGSALEQAGTINPDTYVWASAQTALEPLAKRLLTYGGLQWQQGHLENAVTTAQRVAIFENLAPEAHNLETLSQARKLAIATVTNWVPSHEHLFNLLEAMAAVRQIPASSQFYAKAQDSLKSWEVQFADVSHLQIAQMSAQLGWAPTVEWAANQAEQISPERPRRVQAQTLAAHWHLELERIKDRRYLLWANKLAEPGTRASLKMAITEAEKVQRDRPLFGEAQGLIYAWTQNIQTQEDQPYLTLAESLARQGEFREAIQTARLIQPNRPLHNTARAAINQWQQEIWAQQQAEQQRLARRTRTRRTRQAVAVTVEKPTTKLVSAPATPAVVINPPAPTNKAASSPVNTRREEAIAPVIAPPTPPSSENPDSSITVEPVTPAESSAAASSEDLGDSLVQPESTLTELAPIEAIPPESTQLGSAPSPDPLPSAEPTVPASSTTIPSGEAPASSGDISATENSDNASSNPVVPASPVVPTSSEAAETAPPPASNLAPVTPITPAPEPSSSEDSESSVSFNLDTSPQNAGGDNSEIPWDQ